MPYNRPDLETLIKTSETDLQTRIFGPGAALRRSVVTIIARVFAGLVHGLNGFIEWASRQILPLTAENEYLDRHGAIWGLDRKTATFAENKILVTGDLIGAEIPAGTLFTRADGFKYESTEPGILTLSQIYGPADEINIKALEAGAAGNMDKATVLTFVSAVPNVTAATVINDFETGADRELDEIYRARLLSYIQSAPSGGSAADYKNWALEAPGISDAVVFPTAYGPGSVLISVGDWTKKPYTATAAAVETAQNIINENRPVTAAAFVVGVTPVNVNLNIKLNPNTPEVKANVEKEIDSLFSRRARPGVTISKTVISEAISRAAGEIDHVINTIIINGQQVNEVYLTNTQTAVLNDLTAVNL